MRRQVSFLVVITALALAWLQSCAIAVSSSPQIVNRTPQLHRRHARGQMYNVLSIPPRTVTAADLSRDADRPSDSSCRGSDDLWRSRRCTNRRRNSGFFYDACLRTIVVGHDTAVVDAIRGDRKRPLGVDYPVIAFGGGGVGGGTSSAGRRRPDDRSAHQSDRDSRGETVWIVASYEIMNRCPDDLVCQDMPTGASRNTQLGSRRGMRSETWHVVCVPPRSNFRMRLDGKLVRMGYDEALAAANLFGFSRQSIPQIPGDDGGSGSSSSGSNGERDQHVRGSPAARYDLASTSSRQPYDKKRLR